MGLEGNKRNNSKETKKSSELAKLARAAALGIGAFAAGSEIGHNQREKNDHIEMIGKSVFGNFENDGNPMSAEDTAFMNSKKLRYEDFRRSENIEDRRISNMPAEKSRQRELEEERLSREGRAKLKAAIEAARKAFEKDKLKKLRKKDGAIS